MMAGCRVVPFQGEVSARVFIHMVEWRRGGIATVNNLVFNCLHNAGTTVRYKNCYLKVCVT
jgi:hypothetical protein